MYTIVTSSQICWDYDIIVRVGASLAKSKSNSSTNNFAITYLLPGDFVFINLSLIFVESFELLCLLRVQLGNERRAGVQISNHSNKIRQLVFRIVR